jgi:hypothetical protein
MTGAGCTQRALDISPAGGKVRMPNRKSANPHLSHAPVLQHNLLAYQLGGMGTDDRPCPA